MRFQLPITFPKLPQPIHYTNKVLLMGSCFTEHISDRLSAYRFQTLQNPHGILFNPMSVANSLSSYAASKSYTDEDLFLLNELWGSWSHHTRFSHILKEEALRSINAAQQEASTFLKECNWVVITLGSAFQYFLKESGMPVSNNHRAPAAWFDKRLLEIAAIYEALSTALDTAQAVNPGLQFLFTISPVRHIRDGVTENNRSKARLIETVHALCNTRKDSHYFPAYELVIDVLRDYRFYDIDLVHPNYAATETVWEAFVDSCLAAEAVPIMEQVADIVTAMKHRPRFPDTEAHKQFLKVYAEKTAALGAAYPFLNLAAEANYFSKGR
ncbi:MAG: GSCFA domain-containing protein [Bacteroidetes bacterium]|nr:GSCFA domain-containing protein [Bacteroidota bacterium]MBS1629208.1 GSCFA domain-containing protein [Bacteroidota bacterium]